MREMEKIMQRIKTQIEKLQTENNPDSSEQSGYDNSHTHKNNIYDNSQSLIESEKPFAYAIAHQLEQKNFLDPSEHNIYSMVGRMAHSKCFRTIDDAKLALSKQSGISEHWESKRSDSFHDSQLNKKPSKDVNSYMGLKLFVNSNEWCLIAQGWGIYPQVLYKWCRDKGVQRTVAAIQHVHQIGDGYFNRKQIPLNQQRGKYLNHMMSSIGGQHENTRTQS